MYELVRISASDPSVLRSPRWRGPHHRGDPVPELITDLNIELTYDEDSGVIRLRPYMALSELFEDLSCGDIDISALLSRSTRSGATLSEIRPRLHD